VCVRGLDMEARLKGVCAALDTGRYVPDRTRVQLMLCVELRLTHHQVCARATFIDVQVAARGTCPVARTELCLRVEGGTYNSRIIQRAVLCQCGSSN